MIFHVRLISLPGQTSGLVEALTDEAGVSNLVVLPGTAQRLRGDAVQFDEAKIRSDAVYAPSFYVLLAIAGLIGAVGIDKGTRQPVLRGIPALLAGFSAAMVVTLLFALAIRWSGHTPKLYSGPGSGGGLWAAPQCDGADRHGRARPARPADHLGRPRTGRAIPERAGRRLATSCQVTAWTLAQSAAMSITVHLWSAAAARIWSVPLPRMGSRS